MGRVKAPWLLKMQWLSTIMHTCRCGGHESHNHLTLASTEIARLPSECQKLKQITERRIGRFWRLRKFSHAEPKFVSRLQFGVEAKRTQRKCSPGAPRRRARCLVAVSISCLGELVDLVGFEPTTSSMPWKRAPNCATGPF